MASRARRSNPRPPARRGSAAFRAALKTPPLVNGFGVEFVAPVNGFHSRDRRPELTVIGVSLVGTPVDIQIEWRTQKATQPGTNPTPTTPWVPTPTYTTTLQDAISGTPQNIEPPTDLSYQTWWYRGRVGNSDTNVWSDWSAQYFLDIYPILGSAAEYVNINIGIETLPRLDFAAAYLEMNVGVGNEDQLVLSRYLEMNVGVGSNLKLAAEYSNMNVYPPPGEITTAIYTDLNTVTDETPVPHIWWIRPEQGKEGYIFNIYGQGFGAFQNQFDGEVRLGSLVCSIARWDIVPAALVASTVKVSGRPRTSASTTDQPYVLLNSGSRIVQEGDIIEFDMMWEVPSSTRLDIFPSFDISGTSTDMGYGSALLNDTTGDPWVSDQPEAYGTWHHRRFVVPSGHFLVGKTISNFSVKWYGSDVSQPIRTGSVRSFVIRQADETPVLWVTGDDNESAPLMTYVANTGTLDYTEFDQEGYVIEHGMALDADVITPEHGWIVAIVPTGAVSSMVRVVLEDV